MKQKEFVTDWKLDTSIHNTIAFKGYEGKEVTSKITGQKRLSYDRKQPFEKDIPFFNHYVPTASIIKPKAYIIPQGWHWVIERLELNQVAMQRLDKDTTISVEVYHIEDYKTYDNPYEGHYLHYSTRVSRQQNPVRFLKGDFVIYTDQVANRYLIETLEPTAPDSFFNWNFFDAILQQKEGYSDYVFEDLAILVLQNDPGLREKFEHKKRVESGFAQDGREQLDFIYKNSPHYEEAYRRYPVFRLAGD